MPDGANKILDERTIENDNRNLLGLLKKISVYWMLAVDPEQ